MNVVFNLQNVGLGNNGGSRTVIKCAENMSKIGAKVTVWTKNNKYTWHKPSGINITNKCPNADVIVATGYKSVASTLKSKINKKFYYIRGYETWTANESDLIESFKKLNCIVNSEWLHNKLKSHGVQSHIVYPGLDLDTFYNMGKSRRLIIGGLFHKKHTTKRHQDIEDIGERSGYSVKLLNRDFKNPSESELNRWYNNLSVWVAPTELEGLHNPPMESSLAGCVLVCNNHPRNGMHDYTTKDTALIYPSRQTNVGAELVREAMTSKSIRKRLNDNMISLLKSKIGGRKTNMQKMLDIMR